MGTAAIAISGAASGQPPVKPPAIVNWIGCGNVAPGLDKIVAHGSQRAFDIVVSSRLGNKGRGNGGEAIDWTIVWNPDPFGPNTWNIECFTTENEDEGGTFRFVVNGQVIFEAPIEEVDPADFLLD
jgi:hypothetical protein